MTTSNLGRISIVPKGNWAAGTYKALDLVRYNGSSYLAKGTTTALPTDTSAWTLIVADGATGATGSTGATGPAGTNGTNGVSLYTWIKYADDASGAGLSDSPTGKSYIGIAVNNISSTESTTAGDYTWSLIKGADGQGTPSDSLPLVNGTAAAGTLTTYSRADHIHPKDSTKQDTLVSGTSIKTVNGNSLLGSGDITITGGSGTVTTISVVSANGLAGTVVNATTTPTITLSTSITGILKGNGTAISAAVADDFPTLNQNTTGTSANVTGTVSVANGGTGVTTSTGTGSVVLSTSPTFTGTPSAPTASAGTSTTQIATTAFVATNFAALKGTATVFGGAKFSLSGTTLTITTV